ncbi:hypothetical protein B4082_5450 [Bacillus cereus]|uniref:Uncharacterized protein n=1 Tax=Bacillus cereus TaxID=1396 RepID=A0A164BQS4_BACCE|nr:hypothetical protein B4082_5450 [Bacillus cereus]
MIFDSSTNKKLLILLFFENVINIIPFKFQMLAQPIDKKSY